MLNTLISIVVISIMLFAISSLLLMHIRNVDIVYMFIFENKAYRNLLKTRILNRRNKLQIINFSDLEKYYLGLKSGEIYIVKDVLRSGDLSIYRHNSIKSEKTDEVLVSTFWTHIIKDKIKLGN